MKVYANLYELSDLKLPGYEFEVLNELKDLSNRSDANCLYHTRFLFEMDYLPLKEQCKLAETIKDKLVRVVYSGSKSLHCIVEFDKQYEDQCKKYYKEIWQTINEELFGGNCDSQCVNPARLTRTPNVIRHDTGKRQTLIYDMPGNYIKNAPVVIRDARSIQQMHYIKNALKPPVNASNYNRNNDGKCLNYDVIKHYLETPYPKKTGNGDSSLSLFKAVLCCLKYNDRITLSLLLNKAKNEHWSDKELEHTIESARKKL